MYRSILVVYASAADDGGLDHAVALAVEHRARLTVAVPVPGPPWVAYLGYIDAGDVHREMADAVDRLARRATARVPADVSLTIRGISRSRETELAREIAANAYDLCVACGGRRDPGVWHGRMGLRLQRAARRCGVAALLVPPVALAK